MTAITPCLWFNDRIDEAVDFYTATFPEAKLLDEVRHDPNGPRFTAVIELAGHKFFLLNGSGSQPSANPFTWAVSFMVECSGQEEVDYYWNSFVDNGGKPSMCGWCEDKFGLSWQIVPKQIHETVMGADPAGAKRATDAMLKMGKLIVADLEKAYRGD